VPPIFKAFDLLNLPNPEVNIAESAITEDIHVLQFIYDDEE
jgi:hypothetical protein